MSDIRAKRARTDRGRVPIWLLVAGGVLLVGIAAVVALMMNNRGGGPAPEAEVVTLPVPTPTVEPVAREDGSAFYDALPSTVLAFALAESGEAPDLLAAGAVEAWSLGYTDGAATLTVQAGQWATPEAAAAAYERIAAALVAEAEAAPETPAADETADPSADPSASADDEQAAGPEQGAVLVDGAEVGSYTLVPRADGSATVVWSNGTAVLRGDGPLDALRDVYAAFPL